MTHTVAAAVVVVAAALCRVCAVNELNAAQHGLRFALVRSFDFRTWLPFSYMRAVRRRFI